MPAWATENPGVQNTKLAEAEASTGREGEGEHHQYVLVTEKEPTLLIRPDSMQDHTWF